MLFVVCCVLCVVRCVLVVVWCVVCVGCFCVWCLAFGVSSWMFVVRCSWHVGCWLLFVDCCNSFCGLLIVV